MRILGLLEYLQKTCILLVKFKLISLLIIHFCLQNLNYKLLLLVNSKTLLHLKARPNEKEAYSVPQLSVTIFHPGQMREYSSLLSRKFWTSNFTRIDESCQVCKRDSGKIRAIKSVHFVFCNSCFPLAYVYISWFKHKRNSKVLSNSPKTFLSTLKFDSSGVLVVRMTILLKRIYILFRRQILYSRIVFLIQETSFL